MFNLVHQIVFGLLFISVSLFPAEYVIPYLYIMFEVTFQIELPPVVIFQDHNIYSLCDSHFAHRLYFRSVQLPV